MNSRGTSTGVVGLVAHGRAYHTRRKAIPEFVARSLKTIYQTANLKSGCPDLVIWHRQHKRLRLVEVKGPEDRIGDEQRRFMRVTGRHRIATKMVKWEFRDGAV